MFVHAEFASKYYKILNKIKPDVAIEIGAYDGEFSQHMATVIDPKNVWAFEANPDTYNKYKDSLSHINYINMAISDKQEETALYIVDTEEIWAPGAVSIKNRNDGQQEKIISVVQTNTLDSFVKENNISGDISLWVDVEGANKEVLLGSIETLKNVTSIYIEVETYGFWKNIWFKDDVLKLLHRYNFTAIGQSTDWKQHDIIFVRNDYLETTGYK